ncbi:MULTISPECIES: cysteine--tRNA ligase [unclassified Guyparkeria]|uniref:cysteine--tRNA ligase n=1 Tax=unclassified Guyparkeria TaxID=2626246 RepID=UPI0007337C21|nr:MULTISPECIES: cysteine--tRNA ligase [unclassified Guyparkeria]KTG15903.1 cysteine--tRNA ligase [Guyparkeria sp. XI15]OAE84653.1 cysteine--tRNA ligase [Guyparkeria sp. WRN-7]
MLTIYDSAARAKREFTPIRPGHVGIYVCGMTVYDRCHIGHARVLVVFDMVVRYLKERGFEVNYVRNITDIDDKIIARAAENAESIESLTDRFITLMRRDAEALGCLPPTSQPRATENVDEMIAMIETLIERGNAYRADNGDVYFDVSTFDRYGALSGRDPEDLRAGARVAVDEAKDDPLDFVLWKHAKADEPRWDAPFGPGRPGWHIECSAMSTDALGTTFDIHGGGHDLMFPHHENEIAQSECATGCHFVNYWMHNGFVRVDDEKMSKSLGNFFTIEEVTQRYHPEVVRLFILSSHYRSPLNYSDQHLDAAQASLSRWYSALKKVPANAEPIPEVMDAFHDAMDDDFNTPKAIALIHEQLSLVHKIGEEDKEAAAPHAAAVNAMGAILNLGQLDPDAFLHWSAEGDRDDTLDDADINQLIAQRAEARAARNFEESDRIRDLLLDNGITLEDGPQGTTWRRQ